MPSTPETDDAHRTAPARNAPANATCATTPARRDPADATRRTPGTFLLIQTRPEDDAAASEFEAVQRLGGFAADQLVPLRLGAELLEGPAPTHDWPALVAEHAGVVLSGSPYTTSDAPETKSAVQHRVEAELRLLLEAVTAADSPFLGCCYGVGTLGRFAGGTVDTTYGESAGPVEVALTDDGAADPVLAGLPPRFHAYVGHKEALTTPPPGAVTLVRGQACPVQMFRLGRHQYATQFHPELDQAGVLERLRIYRDHGYMAPGDAAATFARIEAIDADQPPRVLENFRRVYESRSD